MPAPTTATTTTLGRPPALDARAQATILRLLAEGNFVGVACGAAGITTSGYRHWRLRWERDDPVAVERFGPFFQAIGVAQAAGEVAALARLRQCRPDWLRDAWFLSRRWPERWGRRNRHDRSHHHAILPSMT